MYSYDRQPRDGSAAFDHPSLQQSVRSVTANSLAAVLPVFVKIEDWMRVLGYPHRDLVAVMLSLREAVLNAVQHGHHGDPAKQIRLKYVVTSTEVLVEVEDEGFGFDPDCQPDAIVGWEEQQPRGRGLFLMRSYTTWLSFNPTGNRVTLCRQRTEV